jgi:hypothetical protein
MGLRSSKDDCEVSGGETSCQRSKVGFLEGVEDSFRSPDISS